MQLGDDIVELITHVRRPCEVRLCDPQPFTVVRKGNTGYPAGDCFQSRRRRSKNLQVCRSGWGMLEPAHEFKEIGGVDVDGQSKALLLNLLGTTLKHLIHRAFTTHGRHLC
jgi:hypothetical protein